MKTITARGEVGADGKLRLELETALPAGPVDVVLVIQPAESPAGPPVFSATMFKEHRTPGEFDDPDPLANLERDWRQNVEVLEPRAPGEWADGRNAKWGHS